MLTPPPPKSAQQSDDIRLPASAHVHTARCSFIVKGSLTLFIVMFSCIAADPVSQWWTKPKDIVDHFYTISTTERDKAVTDLGFTSEGTCCWVSDSLKPGTIALYRLFNPKSGDHFYTTSPSERDTAVNQSGYTYEGLCCYVLPTAASASPLYRLFNPGSGDHFYTTSDAERMKAINGAGYRDEGVCCYVSTFSTGVENTPLLRLYLHKSTGSSTPPAPGPSEACSYTASITNETCYNLDGTASQFLTPHTLQGIGCGATSANALGRAKVYLETQTCLTQEPNPKAGCCTYSSQVVQGCGCK